MTEKNYDEALQEFLERVSTLFNSSKSARNVSDIYSENARLTVKEKRDQDQNVRTVSGITNIRAYFDQGITVGHEIVEGKVELPPIANGTVTAVLVGNIVDHSFHLGRVSRVIVIQIVDAAINQFRIITDDVELTFIDQTSMKLPVVSSCSSTSLQDSDDDVDIDVDECRLQLIGSENSEASSSSRDGIRQTEAAQINPVGYLNEYCQKSRRNMRFEETNLSDGTTFCHQAVVWIGDEQFPPGQAPSKKEARREAARIALEHLLAQPSSVTCQFVEQPASSSSDPDEVIEKYADIDRLNLDPKTVDILSSADKHPISIINEYFQRQKLPLPTFVDELLPNQLFRCSVTVNGECLGSADGQSKKNARTSAAVLAINKLVVNDRFSTDIASLMPKKTLVSMPEMMDNANMYDQIAYQVHQKFFEAAESSVEVADSGKVVAGIVLNDTSNDTAYVISWATGNRCVKGSNLSQEGTVVNDCHAEILSRRGLLRFFYRQLEEWLSASGTSVFANELHDGKLRLKDGLSFHLYINTAPCGDGRVFSIAESEEATTKSNSTSLREHQPLMTDPKKQGVLRTKIESGEGTIPVLEYSSIQTLDGITGGERLRTMSCSDKILKWNVLGLQGALLSNFMHPIYLTSIAIGTLYHHGHLSRAVCCRVGAIGAGLLKPFCVTHPILAKGGFQSNTTRDLSKSTSISVNWNYSDDSVEIVDGQTGLVVRSKQSSRLCKRELFALFRRLCIASNSANLLPSEYYGEVKASACAYRLAQRTLFAFMSECAMGSWLSKPQEEKLFR